MRARSRTGERGAALLMTFFLMLILAGLATAVATFAHNSQMTGASFTRDQQAFYTAEAGLQRARQAVGAGTWTAATSPGNAYSELFGPGVYDVTVVDNGANLYTITSSGYVPNAAAYAARRQLTEDDIPVSTGTNQSLTATATASSTQAGNVASRSNDNDATTFWRAGTQGSGQWLRMDYGSARALNVIVILEEEWITGLSAVEYSSNGTTWSSVPGLSVSSSGTTWTAEFTSTSARYFRVTFTAAASNRRVGVYEFRSYAGVVLGQGEVTTTW